MKKPWHKPTIETITVSATAGSGKGAVAPTATENHIPGPIHGISGPQTGAGGAFCGLSTTQNFTIATSFVDGAVNRGCDIGPS